MNAGGMPNTCKSNGEAKLAWLISGERVSNTWETCPALEHNPGKPELNLHICLSGIA